MTPVLSITYRDSKELSYFNDSDPTVAVSKAAAAYIAAKQNPDVVTAVGGYLVCDVMFLDDLKERTYTYHCSQWYKPGTKVWVPTFGRDGKPCEKQVRVIRTCIRSRQELEQKCPFERYKSIVE